jgi:hypothetical protein
LVAPLLICAVIIRLYPGASGENEEAVFAFQGNTQSEVEQIKDNFPDHFRGSSRRFRLSYSDRDTRKPVQLPLSKIQGEPVVGPPPGGWETHEEYFLFRTEGKHGGGRIVLGNGIFYPRLEQISLAVNIVVAFFPS